LAALLGRLRAVKGQSRMRLITSIRKPAARAIATQPFPDSDILGTDSLQTHRWRGMDSNFRSLSLIVDRKAFRTSRDSPLEEAGFEPSPLTATTAQNSTTPCVVVAPVIWPAIRGSGRKAPSSLLTRRWRGMDSNFQFRDAPPTARAPSFAAEGFLEPPKPLFFCRGRRLPG